MSKLSYSLNQKPLLKNDNILIPTHHTNQPFPGRLGFLVLVDVVGLEAGARALVNLRPEREVVADVAEEPAFISEDK